MPGALGGSREPHTISLSEWERVIAQRTSGAIDPRGNAVPAGQRRVIRPRRIQADCDWLRWVFN
jgi:hypothetical protein